ncbi:hypothetical protein ACFWHT_00475 [Microbacterium sp. NPDC058342]|uniref:hypothetical protein n=1 Tax=Microbacterium sp. NPDC058342 TaxID=3346454 RepID=UPI0036467372
MAVRNSTTALTSRARKVASDQGYGALRSAHRLNRDHGRRLTIAVLLLPVCAVVFLSMGWRSSPWSPGSSSVAGLIASGGAGLVFLVLSVILVVPTLRRVLWGGARLFLFEHGAVAERLGSHAYVWPYENATIRYVCWEEPWEGDSRDRPQVWVRFQDGEQICFDGYGRKDREELEAALRTLGLSTEPERIGPLTVTKAPTPL